MSHIEIHALKISMTVNGQVRTVEYYFAKGQVQFLTHFIFRAFVLHVPSFPHCLHVNRSIEAKKVHV